MSSLDHSRLEDIRVYGQQAIDRVGSRSVEAFMADVAVRLAVLHCLTLIGEAANQVSAETRRALPAVPWSNVGGFAPRDLPPFVEAIRDFLKDEP